jgi:hypothetical protein
LLASRRETHSPARRRVPKPDRSVQPFDDQVGQLLGQLHLHIHLGVERLEVGQRRPQPEPSKAERGSQPHRSRRFGLALAQFRFGRFESAQQPCGTLAQGFAIGGRADSACGALEQACAEASFQRSEPLGHCRRGQSQRTGCGDQASMSLHSEHQFKVGTVQSFPSEKQCVHRLLIVVRLSLNLFQGVHP